MKLKLVKAPQGLTWVRQGLMVSRQQPLGYIGLLGMTSLSVLLMVSVLRDVGLALATCLAPSIWLGFMLATRRALVGKAITPSVMVEAWRTDKAGQRELLKLSLLYGLAMLAAVQLSAWLGPDNAALAEIQSKAQSVGEVLNDPTVQQGMLLDLLMTLPVTLLFLHAPALILWARVPVLKAVFFSAVASWRNLGAFVLFGLGWFGVLMALALSAGVLATLLPVPFLINVLMAAASMWLAAAFYGSLYFAVTDCFDAPAVDLPA